MKAENLEKIGEIEQLAQSGKIAHAQAFALQTIIIIKNMQEEMGIKDLQELFEKTKEEYLEIKKKADEERRVPSPL